MGTQILGRGSLYYRIRDSGGGARGGGIIMGWMDMGNSRGPTPYTKPCLSGGSTSVSCTNGLILEMS